MWRVGSVELRSRLFLGSARYPSPQVLEASIAAAEAEVVTVSLRRQLASAAEPNPFFATLARTGVRWLPNTAGCRNARDAISVARLAREFFATDWIKLEITGDDDFLQPDPFELVEGARILAEEGFSVFAYSTEDLSVADRLFHVGCAAVMPWGSPIGSGRGLWNVAALRALRERFPDERLIVDAGLGRPSHAATAMELGFDACLVNTAVATAGNPTAMARAFAQAIDAGHTAYRAGMMSEREFAAPSSPVVGVPFWHDRTI